MILQKPLINEINNYLPALNNALNKHYPGRSHYKQNMRAAQNHPGIIYEIPDDDIAAYRELWKHVPENLNAMQKYLETAEIVIDSDGKDKQITDTFRIPKVFTKQPQE